MNVSQYDRDLLKRCLAGKQGAWEDFSDRYAGLVVSVVLYAAQARDVKLVEADRDDLVAEVFARIVDNDYSVLRKFRGDSSLATYLTIVARRIVVRQLAKQQRYKKQEVRLDSVAEPNQPVATKIDREELLRLIKLLEPVEQQVVGMFHLEGKSYEEIHQRLDISVNSIGPMLSRARAKMKAQNPQTTAAH